MGHRCPIFDPDDTAGGRPRGGAYSPPWGGQGGPPPTAKTGGLENPFAKNFEPGIMPYLVGELGMTEAELEVEDRIWKEFTSTRTPPFFPGFLEAVADYVGAGGRFVVVSHSEESVIRRHYAASVNGARLHPELIFGWELGEDRRKPYPYPVTETLRRLNLAPDEVLVVDDLKPGVDMARAAGVDAAAACWSHDIGPVRDFMEEACVATFDTVDDFREFILR